MSELPQGWIDTPFLEVFDIQGGTQPPKKEFLYQETEGYIRLLQIRDFGEKPVPTFVPLREKLKVCQKDDILIGRYGASVGRICTGMEGAYNVALAKVVTPEALYKKFVYYLLKSDIFQTPILSTERSAQDGFNKEDLERIIISLPPLNEQCRIVAKLEKLLAKCEACKQRLDKIPGILKRFRQSILAAACSGRLTADWREQNPDVETASVLLKRILEEKRKNYQQECEIAKEKGQRKPKAPFEDSSPRGFDNQEELPSSWCIALLGNLTETQGGIQKTPKRIPMNNSYPYLRVANVYRGYLKLDEIEYFELFENDLKTWKLEKGDVLIVEGNGSSTEVGRCAIWDGSIENCVHQNHIIRSRPLSGIEANFLLTYLNSPQGMEVMMQLASSTSGLHTLSVSKVNNIIVRVNASSLQRIFGSLISR